VPPIGGNEGCRSAHLSAGPLVTSELQKDEAMAQATARKQEQIIANQKKIMRNQATIVRNQENILRNLKAMLKNQKKILSNQSRGRK
jgi:hypothetical protein